MNVKPRLWIDDVETLESAEPSCVATAPSG